ncbi:MAG: alginate export family protein [Bacteroidales bacterium]
MKKQILLIAIFSIIGLSSIKAQFSLDAELRARGEYRNGYKTLPTKNTNGYFLVHQRTRLIGKYKKDEFTLKLSFQDARVWGQSKFRTNTNTLDLFEAWMKYDFAPNWDFKIGRQVVAYDDKRIFTTAEWQDFGQTLDLALLRYRQKGWSVDFAMGANNNSNADIKEPFLKQYQVNQPKYFGYLWGHKDFFDKKLKVSMLYLSDGSQKKDTPSTIYLRNTFGPDLWLNLNGFLMNGAFYYQTGKSPLGKDLSAYLVAGSVGYQWDNSLKLKLNLDHRSGSNISDGKFATNDNSFDNVFGPGHKYLGFMDYFAKPVQQTSYAGIFDYYLTAHLFPKSKLSAFLAIHYFQLDKPYVYGQEVNNVPTIQKVNRSLGQETDLVLTYKPRPDLRLDLGMSYMLAENTLEVLKGVQGQTEGLPFFGYIQIHFKPQLIKN